MVIKTLSVEEDVSWLLTSKREHSTVPLPHVHCLTASTVVECKWAGYSSNYHVGLKNFGHAAAANMHV